MNVEVLRDAETRKEKQAKDATQQIYVSEAVPPLLGAVFNKIKA